MKNATMGQMMKLGAIKIVQEKETCLSASNSQPMSLLNAVRKSLRST